MGTKKDYQVGFKKPPTDKQFGKPNGNKRGVGFWKKDSTPRFKLEQMMKLDEEQLFAVVQDKSAPYFERRLATAISKGQWKEIESMINQVYGQPKQQQDVTMTVKPLVDINELKED